MQWRRILWVGVALTACNRPPVGEGAAGSDTSEASTSTDSETETGGGETEDSTDTDDGGTEGPDLPPVCDECNGKVYGCRDGMDNDEDGLVDMADPECLSPCHDSEDTLWHGIPAQNWDCDLDCMADANTGQGDDKCFDSLVCDPYAAKDMNCDYAPGSDECNVPITEQCLEKCLPSVPPGCDCFGCCELETPNGPIMIQTAVPDSDCSFSNLEACDSCEQNADCLNPCESENCQWCFGQSGPPPECDEVACPGDSAACGVDGMGNDDCPPCQHCLLGCCVPTPES